MMCGDHGGESIASFWKHLRTLPDYKYHQVLHGLTEEELKQTIPFAIHGDGAEFHRNSEYFVMSWTSAFQTGSGNDNLMSRYPISLVAEAHMSDDDDLWLLMEKRSFYMIKPSKICVIWIFNFRERATINIPRASQGRLQFKVQGSACVCMVSFGFDSV